MTKTITKVITLELVPDELKLAPAAKQSVIEAFTVFVTRMDDIAVKCATITDPKEAKEARMALRDIRLDAEKKRKIMKQEALNYGRALDGINKIIVDKIAPLEEQMEAIEKAVEIRLKAELDVRTKEREALLIPFNISFAHLEVGKMDPAVFEGFLDKVKRDHETKLEVDRAIEEARRLEEEEKAAEQERIRLENIRLQEEAKTREAEISKEAARVAKEKAELEAKAEADRKALEAQQAAELKKLQDEQAEKNRVDREEQAEKDRIAQAERNRLAADAKKLQDELEAKAKVEQERIAREKKFESDRRAIEAKAEKDRLAAEKKEAAAPDKTKLLAFVKHLENLPFPDVKTEGGIEIAAQIGIRIGQLGAWINEKAGEL